MTYWPAEVVNRAPVNDSPPAWASSWGDDRYGLWADLVVGGVTQRMRWIEPTMGDGFWMGSTQEERDNIKEESEREWANKQESDHRLVSITPGFWLANTPCTQAFWLSVMGNNNPSFFSKGVEAKSRPVEQVPFFKNEGKPGVVDFLETLSLLITKGRAELPYEEEWEYACRADTRTAFWWGDTFNPKLANVKDADNIDWDGPNGTTPVEQFPPNPWGLFDMHGNVWEWTLSKWTEKSSDAEDSILLSTVVVRGGSWFTSPSSARAAYRRRGGVTDVFRLLGFRFAIR
jgi:formylglycine-generating enzyme required for sulfatase activity